MSDRIFIGFDTETTGLVNKAARSLSQQPKIIEFAALKLNEDLEEIDRLEFLCNPGEQITPKITRITGIKNEDLIDKEPFSHHYDALCDFFLGVTDLFAHNVQFDCDLLSFELTRMKHHFRFPWPKNRIDTIDLSMPFEGHRLKLVDLFAMAFPGETYNAHRAMDDVVAMTRCLRWMRDEKNIEF